MNKKKNLIVEIATLPSVARNDKKIGEFPSLSAISGIKPRPHERGAVLAIALMVSVFMVILAIPFMTKLSGRYRTTEKAHDTLSALNLAEAGVERGIWEMNYGNISSWSGSSLERTLALNNFAASNGAVVGDIAVSVFHTDSATPIVESTGSVVHIGTKKVSKTLRVVLTLPDGPFDFGIFGDEQVDIHDDVLVDSYDSSAGAYGGDNVHAHANIGSNVDNHKKHDPNHGDYTDGTHHGKIKIHDHSDVEGDAYSGYNSDPDKSIEVRDKSKLNGNKYALDSVIDYPSVTKPTGLTYYGDFHADQHESITISESGQYHKFEISDKATVTITGDVTLYVTDEFKIRNESALVVVPGATLTVIIDRKLTMEDHAVFDNQSHDPKNVLICGTENHKEDINWRSENDFYGVFYAPEARFKMERDGNVFGSVKARKVDIKKNASFHYDEALAGFNPAALNGGASPLLTVKSWQEKII